MHSILHDQQFEDLNLSICYSLNAFCRVFADAVRSGSNYVHIENRPISTNSIWLPCIDLGSAHTDNNFLIFYIRQLNLNKLIE